MTKEEFKKKQIELKLTNLEISKLLGIRERHIEKIRSGDRNITSQVKTSVEILFLVPKNKIKKFLNKT